MKNILLTAFCAVCLPVLGQVKNAGCFLKMVQPENSCSLCMDNDSLKIAFEFNSLNYFCNVKVDNKTNNVISVDWDKFIMVMEGESNSIMFDDTRIIDKNEKKGSTNIAPGTSINKNIAPADYIDLSMALYNKGWIKKHGDQQIGFVIPVSFGNSEKNYTCIINVSQNE